ncbi:AraC family transcriptional regulator [Chromobacterium sp. LK11]|uniref:GlxA family transcriptional regulator n=1 Tax=Chromobacterium sp. LK11 TaxID=1628212 RepID=UPI00065332B8|nr:GlxA family transcriptional regulator [Chromobacterium sp. LK11]KMN78945.1 AraC family transcriptional regulator [Chromobacterium sp. LK11]
MRDFSFVLLPEFSMLGLLAATEPLRVANRFRDGAYRWRLLSADGRPVVASNGMSVAAHGAWDEAEAADAVLVAAGFHPLRHGGAGLLAWLRGQDAAGRVLGGIDTGCFLLAEAGLFRQQRLTLHWEALPAFRERYPLLNATQELYELGPRRISSAGGTASIDMMLALMARSHGHELAVQVSEQFVLGRIRAQSDHQRLELGARYGVHSRKLIQALTLMEKHMDAPLDSAALAAGAGVTARQLQRLFRAQLGAAPNVFYLGLRLEHGRRLLCQSGLNVTQVSAACGFESASYFARAYRRRFGCAPGAERR